MQYFYQTDDGNPLNDANRYARSLTCSDKYVYGGIGGGKEKTGRAGATRYGYGFVSSQIGALMNMFRRTAPGLLPDATTHLLPCRAFPPPDT